MAEAKLPYSDLPRMTGEDPRPRIKADELEGKPFLVKSIKEASGDYGEYLFTVVEVDGIEFVFLCGQQVLMSRLREVKQFPILCLIRKIQQENGRPCWRFFDPDDPFAGE